MAIPDVTPNTQQFTAYAGIGNRMAQVDANGNLSATQTIITGKLADATMITRLTTESNWNNLGVYTGTAITGTYEGMYYLGTYFFYYAYADNSWYRMSIMQNTFSISLTDSNEGEGAGSYFDLVSGKSGRGSIICGDNVGFAEFTFTTAGVVTLLMVSDNVFTSLQTGTNHIVIKDNGTNVRITNELGSTTTFTIEIKYTN
jgi:hypothetical protein